MQILRDCAIDFVLNVATSMKRCNHIIVTNWKCVSKYILNAFKQLSPYIRPCFLKNLLKEQGKMNGTKRFNQKGTQTILPVDLSFVIVPFSKLLIQSQKSYQLNNKLSQNPTKNV